MKKIKVMFIINNLGIGGAERMLTLLLEELSKNHNLELVVVSLEGKGSLEEELKKFPVKIKNFNFNLFIKYISRFDPFFRTRLFLYALKEKPDIIHGQLLRGEDFAKTLGALLNVPVITTHHDVMVFPGRRQLFLNRFLSKAVAVSLPVKEHLLRHYKLSEEQTGLIPDAVKSEEFSGSIKKFNPKKPVFIYVGRIFEHKGLEFAIKGIVKLQKEYKNLEFLIYGDAKFEESYLRKLKTLVLKNKWDFIKFMGTTDNVSAALKRGDIFVLPSKNEGFSMVVLEAAMASKPIIATKTGAIPEMVEEGKSGYFVKFGDAEGIHLAAQKMLKNNEVEKFGQRSFEIVKDKFSIKKVAEMYYNLYLSTIKGKDV